MATIIRFGGTGKKATSTFDYKNLNANDTFEKEFLSFVRFVSLVGKTTQSYTNSNLTIGDITIFHQSSWNVNSGNPYVRLEKAGTTIISNIVNRGEWETFQIYEYPTQFKIFFEGYAEWTVDKTTGVDYSKFKWWGNGYERPSGYDIRAVNFAGGGG